ncbi:MAG: ABC transporter ATP-binding protein [Phycisphaerae bacterium]|nr:ABC transporter ATP-binding protein [Phycisphaerae bacterium]
MVTTNPAVVTQNLTKIYRDFWGRPKVVALDQLNLTLERGEVFGLLGPNGSGKSTTIKLLLGLIFPSRGQATVLDRPAGDTRAAEKLGFLPEESYLYRFLNAEETLDFYGRLFRIPRRSRKQRIHELLDLVGLDAKARKRPLREYSKGMQRRIGLAQALINDPELILLDEPTTGLDPIGTREMKDLILLLKKQGKTVLLCSHLLADVQDVCDRIIILFRGRQLRLGYVSELLQDRDIMQLQIRGGSDSLRKTLEKAIESDKSAKLIGVSHPTNTLEELFLRVIREQTGVDEESSRQVG